MQAHAMRWLQGGDPTCIACTACLSPSNSVRKSAQVLYNRRQPLCELHSGQLQPLRHEDWGDSICGSARPGDRLDIWSSPRVILGTGSVLPPVVPPPARITEANPNRLLHISVLRLTVSMDHNGVAVCVCWVRGWAAGRGLGRLLYASPGPVRLPPPSAC
jgi:hypothetical protein